jgi:hypothetical protein
MSSVLSPEGHRQCQEVLYSVHMATIVLQRVLLYCTTYQPTTNVLTFGQSPASGDPEGPSAMTRYGRVNGKGWPRGHE